MGEESRRERGERRREEEREKGITGAANLGR